MIPAPRRVVENLYPVDPAIVIDAGPNVEACRHIAVRVRAELEARAARSVAIVSAVQAEGKTTVLCDLGLALASLAGGRDVALVDLDLRKPSMAQVLDVSPERGIEEVLDGTATLDDVRVSVRRPAVDLYPALAPRRASHELLVKPRFAQMIDELERRYAIVLIDTPPALLVPDANLILRRVATCLAVARAGQSRARRFRQLVEMLPSRRLLGEILNGVRAQDLNYGYYGTSQGDETDEPRAGDPGGMGSR